MKSVILATVCAAAAIALFLWVRANPDVVFLSDWGDAKWIRPDRPFDVVMQSAERQEVEYRRRWTNHQFPTAGLNIEVRALRRIGVFIDGQPVYDSGPNLAEWKSWRNIDLPTSPGEHELVIRVRNIGGPALLQVFSLEQSLRSGRSWEARIEGGDWVSAVPADEVAPLPGIEHYPNAAEALLKYYPLLLLLFAVGWLISYIRMTSTRFRWVLLAAWVALAARNLFRVPPAVGYDVESHYHYVWVLVSQFRLPLADEGMQTFQSPLMYLLSAPVCMLALKLQVTAEQLVAAFRIIPILCGIAQIEICRVAARYAFPRRDDLVCLTMVIGGFVPVNLAMCQIFGNEPLLAFWLGISIVFGLRYLRKPAARTTSTAVKWGGALGLALLSKVSGFLLVPVAMLVTFRRVRHVCGLLIACACICGWYYVRNVYFFGKPFVSGWDPARLPWWQDPGYRTAEMFSSFGQALIAPVYSARFGIWDSLYSSIWGDGMLSGLAPNEFIPPWNYSLMVLSMWLSLPLTLAGLYGIWLARRDKCLCFLAICVGVFLAALTHLYLVLPIYSTAKGSYLLGVAPAIAVLIVAGLGRLKELGVGTRLLNAWIFTWFAVVYGTFWGTFS